MAKTAIQIERYTCDGCDETVDGDVDGQLAAGLHFTVTAVDHAGDYTKVEGFACRQSHLKKAVEALLDKEDPEAS